MTVDKILITTGDSTSDEAIVDKINIVEMKIEMERIFIILIFFFLFF